MDRFVKKEKLYIDPETGKSEWVTIQRGITIPKIKRKQPSEFDQAVKDFQKAEKAKIKQEKEKKRSARKKKWDGYRKKLDKGRRDLGKKINPDILTPSYDFYSKPKSKSKKSKSKKKYYVKDGVAYPIAGTGKKKKPKKKEASEGWVDPFNIEGGLF